MPAVDAVIVAAIVAAFVIFGAVLAWAEHQTRNLPPPVRSAGKAGRAGLWKERWRQTPEGRVNGTMFERAAIFSVIAKLAKIPCT
ncbi:MAG: hypothetical protein ACLP19_02360 [Xanthobacteraceae bacterium]